MFELMLAEALGWLIRDQADIERLFKRLRFATVEIVKFAEGLIAEFSCRPEGKDDTYVLSATCALHARSLSPNASVAAG